MQVARTLFCFNSCHRNTWRPFTSVFRRCKRALKYKWLRIETICHLCGNIATVNWPFTSWPSSLSSPWGLRLLPSLLPSLPCWWLGGEGTFAECKSHSRQAFLEPEETTSWDTAKARVSTSPMSQVKHHRRQIGVRGITSRHYVYLMQ